MTKKPRARTWTLLAAAALSSLASTAPPARSATSLGTLDARHPVVRWKGGPFSNALGLPGPSVPRPEVCEITCERRTLSIQLPSSAWTRPGDGVVIGIKHLDLNDGINLYVYDPGGKLVGSSDALGADGQAVFLKHPARGTYTIIVNVTELANHNVTYKGEARMRPDPCRKGSCLPLPKLQPAPPYDFHVTGLPVAPSTELGFPFPFSFGPATPQSCWVDETTTQSAHRCLRFSSEIDNLGDGALVVRFHLIDPVARPGIDPQNEYLTGCEMQQVIERDGGAAASRDAGPCVYHVPHGHFHYQNLARFFLYSVTGSGKTGKLLRSSNKVGFCLTDAVAVGFGSPRLSARSFWFPNCNLPSQIDPNTWVQMGISLGWGDVYTWDVPQQYIEITGIRDGVYDVVSETNPLGEIREKDGHTRGRARTRICLKGETVTVLMAAARSCPPAKT